MEIQELVLKHYGKFDHHTIQLNSGMNIIYGGNEMGKTTIHSFIRAMFFGLNRGRGRAAIRDEYQIRQPWDCPGAFLGSMRIREQGKVYRIDRCFDRSTKPLQLVCETTARESSDPERDLAELLGGISEATFVNTVFIPQAQCETDESFAGELQRFMVNSDSALDAGTDVNRALQLLRKKKKYFEQRKKKTEEDLEKQIGKKQEKAEVIRAELEILKQQQSSYRQDLPRRREQRYQEEEDREEYTGRGRMVLEILLFLAGLLALSGAFLLQEWTVKVFLAVFGVLFLILIFPVHFLLGGSETDDETEADHGRTAEAANRQEQLRKEIIRREEAYRKLQGELEELYHSHVNMEDDTEIAALSLAIDRICELTAGIYEKSGGRLNERASEILKEITGGRYDRIMLDETMEVRIHTPSRVLGLHQVSGGTMQQIYFALRMAAGEVLCEGKVLPVILDETFAMYDDERLEAVLRWLKKSGRQVILFTCQKREWKICEQI